MPNALLLRSPDRPREKELVLTGAGYEVTTSSSVCEARKLLLDVDFQLLVIESPLLDGSGREVASSAAAMEGLDVVLLVNASQVDALSFSLGRLGVYVLSRTCSAAELRGLLRIIAAGRSRIDRLEERCRKLVRRLNDERVLCEAKCLLARRLGLSEEEAHHMIERRAMDDRTSLIDAALGVRREELARWHQGG